MPRLQSSVCFGLEFVGNLSPRKPCEFQEVVEEDLRADSHADTDTHASTIALGHACRDKVIIHEKSAGNSSESAAFRDHAARDNRPGLVAITGTNRWMDARKGSSKGAYMARDEGIGAYRGKRIGGRVALAPSVGV